VPLAAGAALSLLEAGAALELPGAGAGLGLLAAGEGYRRAVLHRMQRPHGARRRPLLRPPPGSVLSSLIGNMLARGAPGHREERGAE